jgi:hypothetical protein
LRDVQRGRSAASEKDCLGHNLERRMTRIEFS